MKHEMKDIREGRKINRWKTLNAIKLSIESFADEEERNNLLFESRQEFDEALSVKNLLNFTGMKTRRNASGKKK